MAMLNNQMVYTLSSGRCIPLTFDRKDVKNKHLCKSLTQLRSNSKHNILHPAWKIFESDLLAYL